jgi:integrase
VASIAKRDDGRWRARYRDSSGREHARHFDRKLDAQRWLDQVTASIVRGDYVDPREGRVTLRTYAGGWRKTLVGRPATLSIVDNALDRHILPKLGNRPVSSLRRTDVQGLIKGVSETLAPRSTRNVYDTLSRVMAAAVHDRVISHSPCVKIALPPVEAGEVVPPSAETVAALAGAVPGRYRALVVLLAGTGLRIGEALGLEVADVDFLRRTVRVERQRRQDGTLGPTKTAKSTRTVPLGQVVVDELARHVAHHRHGSPDRISMFTDELGRPLTYRTWKRVWKSATTAAGVDVDTHALRHFTASALISGGASVKQVQTVLGHSSAAITLRVYAHLWPGDDDRTRSVMDDALARLADQVRTEEVV